MLRACWEHVESFLPWWWKLLRGCCDLPWTCCCFELSWTCCFRNVIAAMKKLVLMDGMLKEHHSGEFEKPFMLMLQQGLQEVSSKLWVCRFPFHVIAPVLFHHPSSFWFVQKLRENRETWFPNLRSKTTTSIFDVPLHHVMLVITYNSLIIRFFISI